MPDSSENRDRELKLRILAEIAAHVSVYGRDRWDLIRERPEFAHVIGKAAGPSGKRRFFRWVEAVVGGPGADAGGQGRPIEYGEASAVALNEGRRRALLAAQKNLPAAPSPAYMTRAGPRAEANLDFLVMLGGTVADVEKMRAAAVKPDEARPDGEKITNLHVFDRSIDKRLKLIDTALRVMQEVWDLQHQQRFYDEIVAIIVEVMAPYPEAQAEAIRRLENLNSRRGMTLYGEMS